MVRGKETIDADCARVIERAFEASKGDGVIVPTLSANSAFAFLSPLAEISMVQWTVMTSDRSLLQNNGCRMIGWKSILFGSTSNVFAGALRFAWEQNR